MVNRFSLFVIRLCSLERRAKSLEDSPPIPLRFALRVFRDAECAENILLLSAETAESKTLQALRARFPLSNVYRAIPISNLGRYGDRFSLF